MHCAFLLGAARAEVDTKVLWNDTRSFLSADLQKENDSVVLAGLLNELLGLLVAERPRGASGTQLEE